MSGRKRVLLAMLAIVAILALGAGKSARPLFLWNASASVPLGLYRLESTDNRYAAELVVVVPPEPLATFLVEGDYLPRGVPMLTRSYVAMLAPRIGEEQVKGVTSINQRLIARQESPLFPARTRVSPAAMPLSLHRSSVRASAGRFVGGAFALPPPADGLFVRHGITRGLP